jgi:hypothetical protein
MRNLSLLVIEVHERQRGERGMSKVQFVKTALCSNYQTLLEECERALATWNDRRAEIAESRLVGKDVGDELLRLQAKYARAYTVLQHHAYNCSFCQLAARLEGRDYENSSDGPFDNARYR